MLRSLSTLKIDCYDHGGSRIYFEDGHSRELVADTYRESDRELIYNAIRASLESDPRAPDPRHAEEPRP